MTPTDPGSAGELHVSVTGDISALLQALEQVTGEAEKAGQEIAAGLSEGSKAAGDSFEEFVQKVRDGIAPANQFSEAAQEILDKQGKLQAEWLQATQALIEIQDAYEKGAASALDVARAQQEVEAAMERAVPTLHSAAQAEHEVEDGLKNMAEQMLALGEALVITEGLKEFATEALSAYAHVQDLTTAFTLLTGSVDEANTTVATIKEMGNTLAVPMQTIENAAQRMSVSLGGFENVVPVLEAAANVAAFTGRSFDTVAGAIERMALSGTAGNRQLVALGIGAQQLGDALGVTAGEATKAFKQLDTVAERLVILEKALDKTSGAAETMAQNLSGQFTILQNKFEDVMEEVGKALAPLAKELLELLNSTVLPVLQTLVEEFTSLPEPVRNAAVVFGVLVAAIAPITAGLAAVLLSMNALSGIIPAVTEMIGLFGATSATAAVEETALAEATTAFGTAAEGASVGIKGLLGGLAEFSPLLLGAGAAILATSIQLENLKEKYADLDREIRTHQIIEALNTGKTTEDLKKLGFSLDEVKTALGGVKNGLNDGKVATDGFGLGIKMLADSSDDWSKAAQKVVDEQAKANEKVKEAKQAVAELSQALKDGYPVAAELARAQVELQKAVDGLTPKVHAAAAAHHAHADAMQKASDKALASLNPFSQMVGQLKALNDITQILADNTINVNGKMTFAAEGFTDYSVSVAEAGAKIIDFSNNVEGTGQVMGDFDGIAGITVQRLTDMMGAAHGLAGAMVDLGGGLQSAAAALVEVNARASQHLDTWGQIAAAEGHAASALGAYGASLSDVNARASQLLDTWSQVSGHQASFEAGSSVGDASPGFGPVKGTVSGLQMVAFAGAVPFGVGSNIVPNETTQAMIALGYEVVGNLMFATKEELAALTKSIGDAHSEWTDLAGRVHNVAAAIADTTDVITTFTKSMDENGKIVTHATTHTAQDLNNIPWTTLKQNVDQAGNALESFGGIGTNVYNVNAHLEDLVAGITNADEAFGGVIRLGAQIAQATAVVGAAAQVAAVAAGVALSTLPRSSGAMQLPTVFHPSLPSYSAAPAGVANANTLGTNPQGVSILVTGNAITSQDSAQRLAATMVAALRNNAGLKL